MRPGAHDTFKLVDVVQDLALDRYFTKIDLSKGYWQFPVETEDVRKTAFVVHNGTYEFLRMLFGLVNSAATLVKGLRKLLQGLEYANHYMDDIVVHTPTWGKHVTAHRGILWRIARTHLTVRPSKCFVGARTLSFIGHEIRHGLIHPSEENVLKMRKAKRSGTKKELRAFLRLTGFQWEYLFNYSAIAVPLTDLTKKDCQTNWNRRKRGRGRIWR